MFKLINFAVILLLLPTPYAFAQSIFDQPASKSTAPSGSMSASDFKSSVNQMTQQTNNGLSQQAKQLYPKSQAGTKGTTPPGAQQPDNQQAATPSTVDNSFSVNSGAPAAPTKAQPGAAPSQPADNYTGFGGGSSSGTTSKKPSAPASSGSSGGWNINY